MFFGEAETDVPVRLVGRESAAAKPNYADYDLPPTMRRQSAPVEPQRAARQPEIQAASSAETQTAMDSLSSNASKDMEMLDIPAFLRRQAN